MVIVVIVCPSFKFNRALKESDDSVAKHGKVCFRTSFQVTQISDPGPETESDWHFIFGGKRSTELFNWKTGQRCYLPNEPPIRMQHPSGVLFNRETPAACCAKQCMVFNRTTLNWTMVKTS